MFITANLAKLQRAPTGAGYEQVTAGDRHTCAVDLGGAVWCWGANDCCHLVDGGW